MSVNNIEILKMAAGLESGAADYEIVETLRYSDSVDVDIDGVAHTCLVINNKGGEGCGDHVEATFAVIKSDRVIKYEGLRAKADRGLLEDIVALVSFLNTEPLFCHTFTGYYESYSGADWTSGDNYETTPTVEHSISY